MICATLYKFCPHGMVEIRCLGVDGKSNRTDSGYFNDFNIAAAAVQQYVNDRSTRGVYFVLNRFTPSLIARASNRFEQWTKCTTTDADITWRNWFFIDCDSKRPTGISATQAELERTYHRAIEIWNWLVQQGFPAPTLAGSGNGIHLHCSINLPNDQNSFELVRGVLRTLDAKFSDADVKIDTAVSNAARICRLYGTIARKGDNTPDRPHRISQLLYVPDYIARRSGEFCHPEALRAVAAMSEPQKQVHTTKSTIALASGTPKLMVGQYLHDMGIEFTKKPESEAWAKYLLKECPFNPDHKSPDAMVTQHRDGGIGFKCLHDSCSEHKWQEFKQQVGEPKPEHYNPPRQSYNDLQIAGINGDQSALTNDEQRLLQFERRSVWSAIENPRPMRETVIEGLVRRGEVMNIVAATKMGKSWLAAGMAFCIATGRPWLGRSVVKGNVLLIDNELHEETIENRMATVANAMNLKYDAAQHGALNYISLRGNLASITEIETALMNSEPGHQTAVIFDAKFRFFGSMVENSNEDQTTFHNIVDRLAKHLNCVIVLIHHSTKGDQGGKSVTDVGSGGSAQSRAADCHLVIRPHTEEGMAVLDAAVRTFKPVEPQTLRWEFPLWKAVDGVEAILKADKTRGDTRQESKDHKAICELTKIMQEANGKSLTRYELNAKFGGGYDRLKRLIRLGIAGGRIVQTGTRECKNGPAEEYTVSSYSQPTMPGLASSKTGLCQPPESSS